MGRSLVVPQGEGDSNNQLEQQQQQQQSLSPILKKYQNWRSKEGSGRRRRGGEGGWEHTGKQTGNQNETRSHERRRERERETWSFSSVQKALTSQPWPVAERPLHQ